MKTLVQNGNIFNIQNVAISDSYRIPQNFSSAFEVCEYLKEHGEVAESTSTIIFTLNNKEIALLINENFDDETYHNLEFCLMVA